jgi:hypothetical protein
MCAQVPNRQELWSLLATHGGAFERMLTPAVTHVLVSEMPDNKIQQWRRQPAANRKPHVLPTWLVESVAAGRMLPCHSFLHPRLRDTSQRSMATLAAAAAVPVTAAATSVSSSSATRYTRLLQHRLFTPELQWQPRGQRRIYLTGVSRTPARQDTSRGNRWASVASSL